MLRSYLMDEKSNEHILQFAPEGWFISDLYSFITEDSSNINIDAIESAEFYFPIKPEAIAKSAANASIETNLALRWF
jgi:hypothetical protein